MDKATIDEKTDPETVEAWPTKSFFVDMLTRDISVIAALLDLCDNALGRTFDLAKIEPSSFVVDGKPAGKPLKSYFLHLTISGSKIVVEDNCGGIGLDAARHEIFRLGRDSSHPVRAGLSVYGIGMKRAFFKLADDISLRSSAGHEWFDIAFKVSEWKDKGDDDWNLEFNRHGTSDRPNSVPKNGTRIELKELLDGTKSLISSSTFMNDLRDRLQSTYSLFVAFGLDLRLNAKAIADSMPALSSELMPARRNLERIGKVKVVIIAGLTAKQVQADPTRAGWFIYCNGRLVLEADKTRVTGWGDGQMWHAKYNRFVGFVFFDSKDGRELPWTTTKQGVVEEAEVFLRTKQEMKVQARPVLEFLSRVYPGEVPPEGVHERRLLESRGSISLSAIPKSEHAFTVPKSKRKAREQVSIQYKKDVNVVDLVRRKLGRRMSASEIGSKTFDYYVKTECSE